MKKKLCLLLLIMLLRCSLLSNNLGLGATGIWIEENTPGHNSVVEKLDLVLKVKVIENEKPLMNVWVHFYLDDERIDSCFIEPTGVASLYIGELEEHGYHTWQVKVDKPHTDSYWSSKWRFNYQPRPALTLYSKYGKTYGEGNYTYGETADFGLESPIIEISEGKRLVFTAWESYQEYGYSGSEYSSNLEMLQDIREIAFWKTQYYLNMSSELPKYVYPKSGWYDEGKVLGIYTESPIGTQFVSWVGLGNNSYTGDDSYQSIKMTSPLHEKAFFTRENYSLTIISENGESWGGGIFPAWENASFGIESKFIRTEPGERWIFSGWNTDSIYGYNGNNANYTLEIGGNITQVAEWQKQYYINISQTEGGNVTAESGWIDDNNEIELNYDTQEGYIFVGWTGIDDDSNIFREGNQTIVVSSPLNITACWKKQLTVQIDSELGAVGSGIYLEGDLVTLEAQKTDGLIVKRVFKEWSGDISSSKNPFIFNISSDIEVSAIYEKDYMVFICALGAILALVGIFFIKLIKQ